MLHLIPASAPTTVTPYAVAMAVGFLVGVVGHINKSRPLIIAGIFIVGAVSAYIAFGVARVGG
ncbi:MAG TPA: hypothetical protein VGF70_03890 [Solirubrobacteraceae bacterium]